MMRRGWGRRSRRKTQMEEEMAPWSFTTVVAGEWTMRSRTRSRVSQYVE